jgi:hypothetical protein
MWTSRLGGVFAGLDLVEPGAGESGALGDLLLVEPGQFASSTPQLTTRTPPVPLGIGGAPLVASAFELGGGPGSG